jgi:hypothetical protein
VTGNQLLRDFKGITEFRQEIWAFRLYTLQAWGEFQRLCRMRGKPGIGMFEITAKSI